MSCTHGQLMLDRRAELVGVLLRQVRVHWGALGGGQCSARRPLFGKHRAQLGRLAVDAVGVLVEEGVAVELRGGQGRLEDEGTPPGLAGDRRGRRRWEGGDMNQLGTRWCEPGWVVTDGQRVCADRAKPAREPIGRTGACAHRPESSRVLRRLSNRSDLRWGSALSCRLERRAESPRRRSLRRVPYEPGLGSSAATPTRGPDGGVAGAASSGCGCAVRNS